LIFRENFQVFHKLLSEHKIRLMWAKRQGTCSQPKEHSELCPSSLPQEKSWGDSVQSVLFMHHE
jgi:hypothetical protein